ncbi:MAG: hypothetical protein KDD66_17790, partial [Bdellovibrionales bacterium]|nr:hypothetical protein [Bdellovibrionales bacterium]
TARNPFANMLAQDTFLRFIACENFHSEVCTALALDAIQHHCSGAGGSRDHLQARLTHLKDTLEANNQGFNVAYFRLLRGIFLDIEPEIKAKSGKNIVLKLKGKSDFVDTEYVHFATVGIADNSIAPVTVFTIDPLEQVKKRLKIAKFLIRLFTTDILLQLLERCEISVPSPSEGIVVVCDRNEPKILEEIVVSDLDDRLEI